MVRLNSQLLIVAKIFETKFKKKWSKTFFSGVITAHISVRIAKVIANLYLSQAGDWSKIGLKDLRCGWCILENVDSQVPKDFHVVFCNPYRAKHKLCPTKIWKPFHSHCSPYSLRVAEFAIPRFKTKKCGKHSLTYLGTKLWKKLPGEITGPYHHWAVLKNVFVNVI